MPQCPENEQWVDVPWVNGPYKQDTVALSRSLNHALHVLEEIRAKYTIDSTRQYVTGYSMGGFASWDLATRFPNTYAAVAPVAGWADPTTAPLVAHMPIRAFRTIQ